MTASNFERCVALIFQSEGGYVNNPNDNGGATNMGVTIGTLSAWRGHKVSIYDVKALTKEEAKRIYRSNYWNAVKADQLPMGVDYVVFSAACGSGPSRAIKHFQQALHVADDGEIGPITLAAAHQPRPADLINAFCDRRLTFLKGLDDWVHFGKGWSTRLARERKDALAMAANPIPEPQTHDQPVIPDGPPPVMPRAPDDPGPSIDLPDDPQPALSGFFDALVRFLRAIFSPRQ